MRKLILNNFKLKEGDCINILTGRVEGEELFFKTQSQHNIQLSAEPFITAMLLPAMQRRAMIEIPDELTASSVFISNVYKFQEILSSWYPTLSIIDVKANINDNKSATEISDSAAFFSGGIDACFTLLKEELELKYLVYVRGIDMQLGDDQLWTQCLTRNQEIAELFDKSLVAVESNVRFFIKNLSSTPISWIIGQGCGLASIAHMLGFPKIHISSSNTFKALHPLGSHPLTDPLLSSQKVNIVHVGCETSRYEKLMRISEHEFLLSRLRVCWQDDGFNCGHCDKCLHLRMALKLLNLKSGGELKPLSDYSELENAHTGTLGEYVEWENNLELAKKTNDSNAIKTLTKILNRYKKKQIYKLVDEVFLNSRISRFRQKK